MTRRLAYALLAVTVATSAACGDGGAPDPDAGAITPDAAAPDTDGGPGADAGPDRADTGVAPADAGHGYPAGARFIRPGGDDDADGRSPEAAWRTWPRALGRLAPGDVLVALPGQWTDRATCPDATAPCLASTELPRVVCGAGVASGTPEAPITVRAVPERRAHLLSRGSTSGLHVESCAHWTFEGLFVQGADDDGAGAANVQIQSSAFITLRRLLVDSTNRCHNVHGITLDATEGCRVEECELYRFHRHGIMNWQSRGNVLIRNYAHGGAYDTAECARWDVFRDAGDEGMTAYRASSILFLNNIVEGAAGAFNVHGGCGFGDDNVFRGNIAHRLDRDGAVTDTRSPSGDCGFEETLADRDASHNTFEHQVFAGVGGVGLYANAAVDTRCDHCTFIDVEAGVLSGDYLVSHPGASLHVTNTLIAGTASHGVTIANDADWSVDGLNFSGGVAGWEGPVDPPGHANARNVSTVDPELGGCIAYVPESSPLHASRRGGPTLGAMVLHRYDEAGAPTDAPLWDPESGAFPCGAIVAGINDHPDRGCSTVHRRLAIGTASCPLPTGYGAR